ncbi:hypothetical protein [Deinococcus radiopugnans]|uniref:Uncharacterized protein n=1 Tax=Deinococcus radiopugnans ATCC 19172 TaxID=585398 RepID=A0A5C4XLR6_9DEIO|nr:hypothetical protein [Deinococcus radiopugnans]MBB6018742.1 hypothetical protein [Deinococcus radiopugnans ATCC 19172]TNM64383.1 hypothetical protein FHR04_19795 [Deinococcus radiopugnans ATCC 19172]
MKNPDKDGNSGGYGVTTVLTPTTPGAPDILRQLVVTFVKHGGTIKVGDVFKVQSVDQVEGRVQGDGETAATVLFSADIIGTLKIEWKAVGTKGTVTVLKVSDQFVTLKLDGALLNNAADPSGGSQMLVSGTFSYVPEPR